MKCPKCNTPLNRVRIFKRPEYGQDILMDAEKITKLEVNQCLSCNGIWFDADELNQYLNEKLVILNSPKVTSYKSDDEKVGNCPRCGLQMAKRPSDKIASMIVDACDHCQGVWLDNSEIDRLEQKSFTWTEKHRLVWRQLKSIFKKQVRKGVQEE